MATSIAYLAPLSGSGFWGILLFLLSPLPLLWLGLHKGYKSALGAGCIAGAIFGVSFFFMALPVSLTEYVFQFASTLVICRWALLNQQTDRKEQWHPSGKILVYLTLLGIGVSLTTELLIPIEGLPLDDKLLHKLADEISSSAVMSSEMYHLLVKVMTFLPAIIGVKTILLVVGNAAIAQKILEMRQENIRPKGTFINVQLPSYYIWLFAGIAAIAVSGLLGQVMVNISLIMLTPFLLVGLAFVHKFVKIYQLSAITLGVFYFIMVASGWIIALVTLLGILEPWFESHLKRLEIKKTRA